MSLMAAAQNECNNVGRILRRPCIISISNISSSMFNFYGIAEN